MSAIIDDKFKTLIQTTIGDDTEGLSEISISRPGVVHIEQQGHWFEKVDSRFDRHWLTNFVNAIASMAHQQINASNPILSAELPTGHRIEIVAPPVVDDGNLVLSIRWPSSELLSLDQLEGMGLFDQNKFWKDQLKTAVSSKKNILVSGGTSTGKTTLLNALLNELSSQERVIAIEDSRELVLKGNRSFSLKHISTGNLSVSTDQLLKTCLRLRPDRIIQGEIRGSEAYTWLDMVQTGHDGSMSSIHAGSPDQAINRLVGLITRSGISWDRHHIENIINNVIDVFVQIKRLPDGSRKITEVKFND